MTLTTSILIVEPTAYRPVFDEARRLLGAERGVYTDGSSIFAQQGGCVISNKRGQGYVAWVALEYGLEAPLRDDDDDEEEEEAFRRPVQEWSMRLMFDTAYGYRAKNGAGCSDLHAWLVQEMGRWLTERGLTWYWLNEFTGKWHAATDPVTVLGDPERGALLLEQPGSR